MCSVNAFRLCARDVCEYELFAELCVRIQSEIERSSIYGSAKRCDKYVI